MALALPGSRNIFSLMQNPLSPQLKGRIALHKGVHDALNDFRWMHSNIASRPTRIAELVPLPPVEEGHHDTAGMGAWGIWFPGPHLTPRKGCSSSSPLVWSKNGRTASLPGSSWTPTPPGPAAFDISTQSQTAYILENLQPAGIPSSLDRLKITYVTLPRHSSIWGPRTHCSTQHSKSTSAFNGPFARGNKRIRPLSRLNQFLLPSSGGPRGGYTTVVGHSAG
jgi:hypothetical protein